METDSRLVIRAERREIKEEEVQDGDHASDETRRE